MKVYNRVDLFCVETLTTQTVEKEKIPRNFGIPESIYTFDGKFIIKITHSEFDRKEAKEFSNMKKRATVFECTNFLNAVEHNDYYSLIYKIKNSIDDEVYVGSTTETLQRILTRMKSKTNTEKGPGSINEHMQKTWF